MTGHHTLATWEYEGASLVVDLLIEHGKPTELTLGVLFDGKMRRVTVPTATGTLEEITSGW